MASENSQDAACINVRHGDVVAFIVSVCQNNMRLSMHQRASTVAEEARLGSNIACNYDVMLRAGEEVRGDRRMVRDLFGNVESLCTIRIFVATSKILSQHGIVWFFDALSSYTSINKRTYT